MTELPSAELSGLDHHDINARTKRKQTLLWGAAACLVGIPLLWFVGAWVMDDASKGPDRADVIRRTQATVNAAQGPQADSPAEVLAGQVRDAKLAQQTAETNSQSLQQQLAQAQAQLQTDRADATHTIRALTTQIATPSPIGPGPVGVPGGLAESADGFTQGAALAPSSRLARGRSLLDPRGRLSGLPSASDPGSAPSGDDAAEAPPRRTMQVIRASAASGMGPAGAGTLPAAGMAAANPAGGAKADHAYISSTFETYDSARFVPPNAYASAKVLVGVDAATGTSFSADPKPVLFRLTGPAVHVGANGRFQTTDLTGCMVNGAAYGELPSEKVYIKLQKITCPAGPGKFSVATVEGYVTSKGKAGVRGTVISREGQFTSRALLAGALNGLGQGLSTNVQRSQSGQSATSVGGLLGTTQLTPVQIASGSLGTGVSNAASMLADYYIKRAEQYQPVIEMPTGINVEIVFLSGFQFR